MIGRVSTTAAIAFSIAAAVPAQDAKGPFDVSLSGAHQMNLSPVYQQVIREATAAYRGDLPAVFTTSTVVRHRFRFPASAMNVPPELQEDFDPFPQVPFTLSGKPEKVTPRR